MTSFGRFASTILILLLVVPVAFAQEERASWMAGTARTDITPADSMWMAGYAARERPAQGVLHPIWVKALALQDANGRRAVVVTSDLLGFPRDVADRIAERLQSEHGLARDAIMLTSSHSHSGPVIGRALQDIYPLESEGWARVDAYTKQLEDRIVQTVTRAVASMEPAKVASGIGVVRFAVNRRNNDARLIASLTELAGPSDHSVPVLKVEASDGGLLALLFGYACHATTLSGYDWSGDYPGFAQIDLEARYPGATALFFAGAGADQNPLPRNSVALAEQYGRELAAAVDRVLQEPMHQLEPILQTSYGELSLGLGEAPSPEALRQTAETSSGYPGRWAARLLADIRGGRTLPTRYSYPVQVWRMGGLSIVALGGEVVVDYAVSLKRLFGNDLFVVGYANDVMGYIPSTRILREGGYEGAASQRVYGLPATWNADVEPLIISEVMDRMHAVGERLPESPLD